MVVDNETTILDKWADAQTNDVENNENLRDEFINYQKSIAAEKAAFKATAKAQWPKKFEAYKQAVMEFDETLEGPQRRAAVSKPMTMITDVQQKEGEMIRGQIYDNINERSQLNFDVKKDLKAYIENTEGARAQLKKEHAEWKVAGKRV
jgi:hypothetical protein